MNVTNLLKLSLRGRRFFATPHRGVRGNRVVPEPSDNIEEGASSQKKENIEELLKNSATFNELKSKTSDDFWSSSPYPKVRVRKQEQSSLSVRPKVNPRETTTLLFPGQGAQFVGMGKKLVEYPNVKEMYEAASGILGYDLLKLCTEGPVETLNCTSYCQPAILVTSLAAVERLRAKDPTAIDHCYATAGFSVGEITALVFAGAISFEDAVELVRVRGEAMQLASEVTPSGMATAFLKPDAKIGYGCEVAVKWCRKNGEDNAVCQVANYLYPSCKVIAGTEQALAFLEKNKSDFGIKKMVRLPVSGAFHTDVMRPAVEPFREALKKVDVSTPHISVHSNIDGKRMSTAEKVTKNLPKQICSPVKWEQILHILYERDEGVDFPNTYECGPGSSLKAILKMVNKKAWDSCKSIDT